VLVFQLVYTWMMHNPEIFGKKALIYSTILSLACPSLISRSEEIGLVNSGIPLKGVSSDLLIPIPVRSPRSENFEVSSVDQLILAVKSLKSGDAIKILPGRYELSFPLVIDKSNVLIEGSGESTLLVLQKGANCPVIFTGKDEANPSSFVEGVKLKNLKIDGNRLEQTSEFWRTPGPGGWLTNNGITFRYCRNCSVENVVITGTASGGVVFALTCQDMLVRNVDSSNNAFDAFACGGLFTRSKVIDCNFHDNLYSGISLDLGVNGNEFRNVRCTSNKHSGIFMRASSYNIFKNCPLTGNLEDGVFIADGEELTGNQGCKDNVFEYCDFSGNKRKSVCQVGRKSLGNKIVVAADSKPLVLEQSFPETAPLSVALR
jgi:parallel beta-helix repeat protein